MKARALAAALLVAAAPASAQGSLNAYRIVGDEIPQSLTGAPGDAARGAALMADRTHSLCALCHAGPFAAPHMQGTLAPTLADAGARLSPGQIRLRIVDMKALNPASLMPVYYKLAGGARIADAWRGQSILSAQEIEDLVSFLSTLRGLKDG